MVCIDARRLALWESMSEEQRLETLIQYMQKYVVDRTYDNYILLALAANGFLDITYTHQPLDESVLRHMDKPHVVFNHDPDGIWRKRVVDEINIVHMVPDNHLFHPLVKYMQSFYANGYSRLLDIYSSKFEADFMLSYLLLLIGQENLKRNFRKILLDTYRPEVDNTLHLTTSPIERKYGNWEAFAKAYLNINHGRVLDVCAGIGTFAMHIDLKNTTYVANMPKRMENDLMKMFFYSDAEFSSYYKHNQIQVCEDDLSDLVKKGQLFDYVIFNGDNMYNIHNLGKGESDFIIESHDVLNPFRFKEDSLELIMKLLSSGGKALAVVENENLSYFPEDLYGHCIVDVILISPYRSIVLLNNNKKVNAIKVYDRTTWNDFTAERLLDSINRQEGLITITPEYLDCMGGYLNVDILKRDLYEIEVPVGYKLLKLDNIVNSVIPSIYYGLYDSTKILNYNIEECTPLSPYVTALNGRFPAKHEKDNPFSYFTIKDKVILIHCLNRENYKTCIFDPKEGEIAVDSNYVYLSIDEEKVCIDYLVYQMNEEYFLKQIFPHGRENINHVEDEDIYSCQILVPDGESSIELQKQFIEDLRQREIAKFAKNYGYDLGKFVQYEASNLPKGTTLHSKEYTYTILGNIGYGGFGKVYRAMNEDTMTEVAIKEFFHNALQVRDPQTNEVKVKFSDFDAIDFAEKKFCGEIEKIKECAHDNIVKVYEFFRENNTCYYSMEYIDGENLVNKKCIGEREALAIIRQVAGALKAMHEKGYNHSDVKPQNILIDDNGVATLIDFGGAHYYGYDNDEGVSISGNSVAMKIESPGYTPKCAYDTQKFHAGRDIYSLGATLYYMLTGNSPATIDKQMKPDKISSKSWRAICKAMEEDSRKWLNSMDEFLSLLPGEDEEEINDIDVSEPTRKWRITPTPIVELKMDEVFVFGSNIKGLHTGGAAKQALKWGAQMGVASGPMGDTYAIPTVNVTGLDAIEGYVSQFLKYVEGNDHITFYVTAIGCGSAGFTPEQIAPLFKDCEELSNVYLPESFWRVLMNKGFIP